VIEGPLHGLEKLVGLHGLAHEFEELEMDGAHLRGLLDVGGDHDIDRLAAECLHLLHDVETVLQTAKTIVEEAHGETLTHREVDGRVCIGKGLHTVTAISQQIGHAGKKIDIII
jgi:hypothetical protein